MLVAVEDVTVTSLVYHIITAPCLLVLLIGVTHDTTDTQIGRDRQTDRLTDGIAITISRSSCIGMMTRDKCDFI